jgi:hypothetical protein
VNSQAYGLSNNAICNFHFNLISNAMLLAYPGLVPAMLTDMVMLKVLMMDKPTVEAQLQILDHNMPVLDQAGPNGPRIGKVLGRYENKCYFPAFLIVPLAIILNGFDNLGRSGFLAMKDPGAGIGHGKYTHRIQWHAVMRVITNDFQTHQHGPWQHCPLELFLACMSNVGAVGPALGLPHHSTNLFGYIFDLAADGEGTYCWPDELFTEMRNPAKYPNIGRSASKNWLKRNIEHVAYANASQAYNNAAAAVAARQAAAAKLFDARYARDQIKSRPAPILDSRVRKAEAALAALPVPVVPAAPMAPMEQKRRNMLASNNWVAVGQIPDADPFGPPGAAPRAPINYGDAILVPQGVPPPGPQDIQAALGHARQGLNPAQPLPLLGDHR